MATGKLTATSICWFIVLLVFGYPIALTISTLYICFLPCTLCVEGCIGVTELLHKGQRFPLIISEQMMNIKSQGNSNEPYDVPNA